MQAASPILALYFLSGVTALAYEVLFSRMLSLTFGISIFGVTLTVAAFMFGLGLGSMVGSKLRLPASRLLLVFAVLEGSVAAFALLLPWLGPNLQSVVDGFAGDVLAWYSLQAILFFLVLSLPATALGAAFPVMLHAGQAHRASLASLYGVNALGGAIGALLPLALLPTMGLAWSLRATASIGLSVALAAMVLSRMPARGSAGDRAARPQASLLVAYALVGAAALMVEIGWTRIYGMLFLRTEYVLAVLLAVYLIGIGLGSLLARRMDPVVWLRRIPLLTAGFLILGMYALPLIARWADGASFPNLAAAILVQSAIIALVTLPVTLALGAWLPLIARHESFAGAWYYGANSLGAAMGALAAGFLFFPWLGTAATLALAAMMFVAVGRAFGLSLRWILPVALAIVPIWHLPDADKLLPDTLPGSKTLNVYEDAISITHVVEAADGSRLLLSDLQRMDASTDPVAVAVQENQARLPLILCPEAKRILFLGIGTGITAGASLAFGPLERVGVELSQGAIQSARTWFAPVNHGVMDRLLKVVWDDARRYLRSDKAHYDVIVGDLFHPDLVGRSNLLSVQQFQRVRNRLTAQGVFVQWLALNQFDLASLRVVLRSFARVFDETAMFLDGMHLALVGFRSLPPSASAIQKRLARLPDEASGGEGVWTWLGRYWGRVPRDTGPVQDEWAPRIEFTLPRANLRRTTNLQEILQWLMRIRPPWEKAAERFSLQDGERKAFASAYRATAWNLRAWNEAIGGKDGLSWSRKAFAANPRDRWAGYAVADAMYARMNAAISHGIERRSILQAILKVRPDHLRALADLYRLNLHEGRTKDAQRILVRIKQFLPIPQQREVLLGGNG